MTCPLGIRRHASARRRPPELSLFQRKISRGKYTPGSISSGTGDSSGMNQQVTASPAGDIDMRMTAGRDLGSAWSETHSLT